MTLEYLDDQEVKRKEFLSFALPDIDGTELEEVKDTLSSGWLTTGPKTHLFAKEFAAYVGAQQAIPVNSCTAAMHLALEAIGIGAGDFVITSPYTFAATAEVIRYFHATPIFVDVDPDTLNLDPQRLFETVNDIRQCTKNGRTPRTVAVSRALSNGLRKTIGEIPRTGRVKAIIPVHFAGLPADMDAIKTIAADYNLAIVEDAAHAFPAKYKGDFIGKHPKPGAISNHGWFTCFSFYATKTITTGEGGMICTSDEALADRCRTMALHGISKDAWNRYTSEGSWYYEIVAPGYKYNMTDIAAAIGLAQLRKSDQMWLRRQEIAARYNEVFGPLEALQIPSDRDDCQHAWHIYLIRLNPKQLQIDRVDFIKELKRLNIGTSVHFIPLHIHPYYRKTYGYLPSDFPIAFQQYSLAISLPIYSKMNDQDVDDVLNSVLKVVSKWEKT